MGRLFITAKLARDVIEGRKIDTYRMPALWSPKVGECFGFTVGGRPDICLCECVAESIARGEDLEPERLGLVMELLGPDVVTPATLLRRVVFRLVEVRAEEIRRQNLKAFADWNEPLIGRNPGTERSADPGPGHTTPSGPRTPDVEAQDSYAA